MSKDTSNDTSTNSTDKISYNKALQLLQGYSDLSSFTNPDGSKCNNHYGLYHVKIAQSIARLKKVDAEYVELRNDLIKSYIPDGVFVVPEDKRGEVETLNFALLESECGLSYSDLAKLPQAVLEAGGNKVSLSALGMLGDVIEWTE